MIDLDEMLKKQTPAPIRTLHADFTANVITGITRQKRASWSSRLIHRLRTKLGLTLMGTALLIGGTAAANNVLSSNTTPTLQRKAGVVIVRPIPSVTQVFNRPLPNGDRLVGFATENCQGGPVGVVGAAPNTTMLTQKKENMYYDVPKASPLTDDQLQSTLLAQCEENVSANVLDGIDRSLPKDRQGQISEVYTITAISAQSITVSPDSQSKPDPAYTVIPQAQSLTYTRFDKDLVVYDQTTKSSFSALRTGDDVIMVTKRQTYPLTKEQFKQLPADYKSWQDGHNYIVEAILKIPALTGNPELFFTGSGPYNVVNGLHVYRDVPCTTDPSGFCRAAFGAP